MIPRDTHLVMVGLMGVGKTTVGERVAGLLQRAFVDCDAELERMTGSTAAELAAADGLDALHRLEARVLIDTLRAARPAVITAAASTIEDPQCRAALGDAYVVWLCGDLTVLAQRARTSAHRPVGDDVEAVLRAQAARRDALFAEVADVAIDATQRSPDEIAAAIVDQDSAPSARSRPAT